jgi:hypothetical protein
VNAVADALADMAEVGGLTGRIRQACYRRSGTLAMIVLADWRIPSPNFKEKKMRVNIRGGESSGEKSARSAKPPSGALTSASAVAEPPGHPPANPPKPGETGVLATGATR